MILILFRKKTIVDISIDGNALKLDKFPLPMNGEMRYYARYIMKSQIIEFIPISDEIREIELDENMQYFDQDIKYQFIESKHGIGLSLY